MSGHDLRTFDLGKFIDHVSGLQEALVVERAKVAELEARTTDPFWLARHSKRLARHSKRLVEQLRAERGQLLELLQEAVKESDAFDRGERVMGEWVPRAKELLAIPENGDS